MTEVVLDEEYVAGSMNLTSKASQMLRVAAKAAIPALDFQASRN